MTPQEIAEHRMRWMREGGTPIRIHSDLEATAKNWCRLHLDQHQWFFRAWTAVYEHTFWFEKPYHAQVFQQEFSRWVNQ